MLQFRLSQRMFGIIIVLVLSATAGMALPPPLIFNGANTVLDTGSIALSEPSSIVADGSGNLYVGDAGNNRIVEVTPQGGSSVLAISGLSPALGSPAALAIDGAGNLYIADEGNSRVVVVSPSGTGSVLNVGSIVLSSPQGVAVDSAGNVFIADTANSRIVRVTADGIASVYSVTGLATALNMPKGLAEDISGNLYIADSANHRIVEVSAAGAGAPLNLSGLGTPLSFPSGVTVDRWGAIYIADAGNSRVVEVSSLSSLVTTDLTLANPNGVFADALGTIYIADTSNNRVVTVQKNAVGFGHLQLGTVASTTRTLSFTVAADTNLVSLSLNTLGAADLDFAAGGGTTCAGGSYGSSTTCTIDIQFLPFAPGLRQGGMILSYFAGGTLETMTVPLYGFADAPQAALSPGIASVMNTGGESLGNPFQIAIDGSGNMFVSNFGASKVVEIPASGGDATLVTAGSYTFGAVAGMAFDGAGDLFIADFQNNKIIEITAAGIVSQLTITAEGDSILSPTALATDASGNLYIADYERNRIVKVRPPDVTAPTATLSGTVVNTGGYTFGNLSLTGLAVDGAGNIYASDPDAGQIIKITPAGTASPVTVSGLSTPLNAPQGVGVDRMGNVYIADSGNNRIVEVTTAGVSSVVQVQGLASPTTIGFPFGVSIDAGGNIYIPDWDNARVVKVDVAAASLNFKDTIQGSISADSPKTATVLNLGNQPLVFSASPSYTADFIEDAADTNPCTSATSLAPGTGCDIAVKFTPQSVGSLGTDITVTNNALNIDGSSEPVSVSGTGLTAGDSTSTVVLAGPSPATYGQAVTIAATVNDTAAGNGSSIPTGSVTFTDTVGTTTSSLNGGAGVSLAAGTATLPGVLLNGIGTHTITANYAGVSGVFLSSSNSITETLNKASVTLTGPATQPVALAYGTAGSIPVTVTGQFSGSGISAPSGSVTYTITNSASTVVSSGPLAITSGAVTIPVANTLTAGVYSVVASYAGDGNYKAATAITISLKVNQIQSTVNWTSPSPITYGTTLGGVLNAMAMNGANSVPGTYSYTATPGGAVNASTVLAAGTYSLKVDFTPTDGTNYAIATATVSLKVNQAVPSVSWAHPAAISYGSPLGANQLNASSTISGTFTYTPAAGTVLGAGLQQLSVTFTPTDSTDYTTANVTVPLTVNKAMPSITWATPAAIGYGTALSATQLNASAKVAGTFSYTPAAGAVLGTGSHTLSVTFTPADLTNYSAATATVSLTVDKATPKITWTTPAAITYGKALSATQLNASSTVPGSFAYAPAIGAILGAGSQTLTVSFTPTDATNYTTATGTVSLMVNRAASSVVLTSSQKSVLASNPVTLIATVSSAASMPTGTVMFYDGTSALGGSVVLSHGVASLVTASMPIGTHSLTVIYSGDANILGGTSGTVSEIIEDFNLSLSSGSTTGLTVIPGGTATYHLTVSPLSPATTFPSVIHMTVSGLPTGATYEITPNSLAAGSGTTTVTLTISTPMTSAANTPRPKIRDLSNRLAPLTLALLLLPFTRRMRRGAKRMRYLSLLLLMATAMAAVAGLSGCGSKSTGFFAQAPQSYTITVTGTSGQLSHSATVALTVQ